MTAPVRVLMVEDSETDAKLILLYFRKGGMAVESERVDDPEALLAALKKPWDVVLCDWYMPRLSALDTITLVKRLGLDLPIIIASGAVGEELAVEAMRAGANDYVLKDNLARLMPAVERELREAKVRASVRTAERALAMEQTRFRALIENSSDGISLVADDGLFIYLSPSIKTMLGYDPAELVGQPARTFVHPEDRPCVERELDELRQSFGVPVNMQFRVVHKDGTERWWLARVSNMLRDPAVGAIVANFRDVTERKNAADDLLVSELRFKRLSESGIIAIVVADLSGRILDANDAALQLCGYTRADMVSGGIDWAGMTPAEWASTDANATKQLQTTGVAKPWKKELYHKDGHRVPILLGVAMIDGTKCVTFLADLTEQKRAEAALERTEHQLKQAQKMEAVGRLAGGVAHDFNNLLSVILSHSVFLMEDLMASDPMRADAEEILKAGQRAARLTQQLLILSRQQVVAPKVVDLNELLANMQKMLERILGEDVQLASAPAQDLGLVHVDPSGIEQVIMNLVVNARDAMPTGGKLTIETANVVLDEAYALAHPDTRAGPHVMLAVTDTGTGIDKTTQTRIFEPFFTTKEVGKGTGLGLSTVFGIVQQSGGSIWVYSEVGQGTTFKIYLPRADAGMTAAKPPEEAKAHRGSETILLVEDDDHVRAVARNILRRHGYSVLEARNGGEALLTCEKLRDPLHLLLTDVVMPQMSGPELFQRLTILKPAMKLLCMSGYTDDSVVRHGVLNAEIAFLQKPLTPDTLTAKVREVLDAPPR